MGNGVSYPEEVSLGNRCDSIARSINNDQSDKPSYMTRDKDTNSMRLTICNTRCKYADKWYKIRVYHGDTYAGNLAIFWQARRDRQTPHSFALISDDQVDKYDIGDGCSRMFWKLRRSVDYPGQGEERPYDLVNMAFRNYDSVIVNRAGNESRSRPGAVTSAFCAGGGGRNQCSRGWRIPSMRLFDWGSNVGPANSNVRFYMNNFVNIGGQTMPSKIQDSIHVLAQEDETSGTGSFKRRLYSDIQSSTMSGRDTDPLVPYWEVGYNVNNEKEDYNYPLRFEFVPYNLNGNTLTESDDDVDFVYDMEDQENVLFCYYLCCSDNKMGSGINDVCYNVYTDYLRDYATTLQRDLNQEKWNFTDQMCRIDPNNPRTILNLNKPECQDVCMASGEDNYNRCRTNLINFCQTADLDRITNESDRRIAELYCACYMDRNYYEERAEELLANLRGTPAEEFFENLISRDRWSPYCWFGLCQDSPYNPARVAGTPACSSISFNACLQYIDVTVDNGKVVFNPDRANLNQCLIDNGLVELPQPDPSPIPQPDPSPGPSPGPSPIPQPGFTPSPSPVKSGKKQNTIILVIGGVVLLLLIGTVILTTTKKKKKSNED